MNLQFHVKSYWLVSCCWNDPKLSVACKMSVEKAIATLNKVIYSSSGSKTLHRRATSLLAAIVKHQVEPTLEKNSQI